MTDVASRGLTDDNDTATSDGEGYAYDTPYKCSQCEVGIDPMTTTIESGVLRAPCGACGYANSYIPTPTETSEAAELWGSYTPTVTAPTPDKPEPLSSPPAGLVERVRGLAEFVRLRRGN